MSSAVAFPLLLIGWIALAIVAGYVLYKLLSGAFWVMGRFFAGIGWFVGHVARFVGGMVKDCLRFVGGLVTALFYLLAVVLNLLFGRWETMQHYGRALDDEVMGLFPCLYRLVIGHVANLLLLSSVTEGIEKRVPDVMARAPRDETVGGRAVGADAARGAAAGRGSRPSSGAASFDGYRVIGTLQAGGSGARLFLAEPDEGRRRQLAASGRAAPAQVVIKSFSLEDGSTLPQIVRENRALVAARDLGLVLEHELTADRFHYVMPYVPGEDLAVVTARLHAAAGADGLDEPGLRLAVGYATDLLSTLERFHRAGLWHKDVKPGNIIVSDGRVHLVDLGLITPLRSAMTLTTHGTEYFRDPEMVRLALKGVKVHEVDGVKFDVYGAGAVVFSLLENGFPAHGSLSRLTRRCPEALQLIVRRAMSDMSHRYTSAQEMLADLQCVAAATDPFALRPADLPSFSAQPAVAAALANDGDGAAAGAAASAVAGTAGAARSGMGAVGGAAAARAPAAGIDPAAYAEQERAGWSGRRRRWSPVAASSGRPRRRGGALLVACILIALFISGRFYQETKGSERQTLLTGHSAPFSYQIDMAPAPVLTSTIGNPTDEDAGFPSLRNANIQILEPVSLDRLPLATPGSAAATRTATPLGTILVLDDLPANTSAERRDSIDQLCRRLSEAPWTLLGVGSAGGGVPTVTDETEIALLAGARAAVGLADPSDDEAVARLTLFLREQGTLLDAILWIGRGEGEQPVHTRAIARNDTIARQLTAILGR